MLPRTLYSLHPSLTPMAAAGAGVLADHPASSAYPYPTPQQYAASEEAYRDALLARSYEAQEPHDADHPLPPPPVRQPPTMLAALQRTDLTPEARQRMLRQLAPGGGALEKKYKVIFSSDARRHPLTTGTGDFTVDVTSAIVPTKVHGFELIGYSFPQREWTLEPGETAIPARHGWCPAPGARCFAALSRSLLATPASLSGAASLTPGVVSARSPLHSLPEFNYDGPPVAIVAELPLPMNVVLAAEVLPEDPMAGLPRRMALTLARRVGSVPAAAARVAAFSLENLPGFPLPAYAVPPEHILDEVCEAYVARPALPPPEAPLSLAEALPDADLLQAHTLTLTDPALLAWYPADGPLPGLDAASPAILRCAAPASARQLAALVSAQMRHLLEHRGFYEQNVASAPRVPLSELHLTWEPARGGADQQSSTLTSRFRLRARWLFRQGVLGFDAMGWAAESLRAGASPEAVDAQLNPFLAAVGDRLPELAGLPAALPEELDHRETLGAIWAARRVPRLDAQLTPDAAPVPDSAPVDFFFQALNATAASLRFASQGASFQLPIRDADGTLHLVAVPAGEYRPWGLAAAMTRALRAAPALASLRLVATPVFAGTPGAAPNNSILGFRFESAAAVPQVFGLAFDLPADTYPALLHPARLGYRALAYSGQSLYDPRLFNPGAAAITFPATELGLGVPSPLPAVPYFLPAYANRRLHVHLTGYDPLPATLLPGKAATLALSQPALFHHLQPLSLQTSLAPASLLLDGVAGVEELQPAAAALPWNPAGTLRPFSPAEGGAGPGRADAALEPSDVAAVLALFHAPTVTLDGRTLGQTWVDLFGRAGVDYGGGVSPAADGDLRAFVAAASASAVPSLTQLDALLRRVVAWQDVRSTSAALAEVALKALAAQNEPYPPSTLAGNNGGASTDVFAAALAAHLSLDAAGMEAFLADPWGDLYATLLRRALADDVLAQTVVLASPPAALLPGTTYVFPDTVTITALSPGIDPARVQISGAQNERLTVLVGAATGAGPHSAQLAVASAAWSATIPLVHFHIVNASIAPAAPPSLVHGQRASISYDATQLVPDVAASTGALDIAVDAPGQLVFFTPGPNAAAAVIAFRDVATGTVLSTATLPLADSPLSRYAKLALVVRSGRVSARAAALRDLRGTERHPFDVAAALRDLGATVPTAPSPLDLFQAADPGVALPGELAVAFLPGDFAFAPELQPVWGGLDTRAVVQQILLAAGDFSVVRLNVHPYSLDFVSQTEDRIRPERMGFQEDEYVALYAAGFRGQLPGGSAVAISAVDIDRSGPPYLLLSIQINGSPSPERSGVAISSAAPMASLHNSSENGALTSIGNSLDPARDKQIIRATAYVQLGSDANQLRLLDRQDDRSPIFYPTGMQVNWVRFVVQRPDGTPYNFHGQRTMVALRFLCQPDNPNFVAAASEA
jgi:hypothetical protein